MSNLKEGKSSKGKLMHYSVGAVINKGNKYLLIDRNIPPYGYAGIAGHMNKGETPIKALRREVKEESNLDIKNLKLVFEGEINWQCYKNVKDHYWKLYTCSFTGDVKINIESKSFGWYTPKEIKKLDLESVWKYFFKQLKII